MLGWLFIIFSELIFAVINIQLTSNFFLFLSNCAWHQRLFVGSIDCLKEPRVRQCGSSDFTSRRRSLGKKTSSKFYRIILSHHTKSQAGWDIAFFQCCSHKTIFLNLSLLSWIFPLRSGCYQVCQWRRQGRRYRIGEKTFSFVGRASRRHCPHTMGYAWW